MGFFSAERKRSQRRADDSDERVCFTSKIVGRDEDGNLRYVRLVYDILPADPEVIQIFNQLRRARRQQRKQRRYDFIVKRERDRERKTWAQLAHYLSRSSD